MLRIVLVWHDCHYLRITEDYREEKIVLENHPRSPQQFVTNRQRKKAADEYGADKVPQISAAISVVGKTLKK